MKTSLCKNALKVFECTCAFYDVWHIFCILQAHNNHQIITNIRRYVRTQSYDKHCRKHTLFRSTITVRQWKRYRDLIDILNSNDSEDFLANDDLWINRLDTKKRYSKRQLGVEKIIMILLETILIRLFLKP